MAPARAASSLSFPACAWAWKWATVLLATSMIAWVWRSRES